ncbi:CBF1/Su(H)/LAG-1 family transcription factor Cbf12 [Schizosaccharomyces octosporus yFS286]|uniref:CBF1/Su(H)/LAG-1 family transcription factor Cbf12 n=1 Tax=Schizosaccharomyces octosporus (strain yFS286) TaxID=483514 RepID=S9R0V3_SCHOY|nr:CBF1/Su(H)/LAG-1 family transcription factor Cbf12 [Schizosaccharomyces octosporus yFS286]EPX72070.1 CBF1/Su(H)/LAG-1 family transcription factor Cbf12 [Schizosaccharomyces octosporus yFS286]
MNPRRFRHYSFEKLSPSSFQEYSSEARNVTEPYPPIETHSPQNSFTSMLNSFPFGKDDQLSSNSSVPVEYPSNTSDPSSAFYSRYFQSLQGNVSSELKDTKKMNSPPPPNSGEFNDPCNLYVSPFKIWPADNQQPFQSVYDTLPEAVQSSESDRFQDTAFHSLYNPSFLNPSHLPAYPAQQPISDEISDSLKSTRLSYPQPLSSNPDSLDFPNATAYAFLDSTVPSAANTYPLSAYTTYSSQLPELSTPHDFTYPSSAYADQSMSPLQTPSISLANTSSTNMNSPAIDGIPRTTHKLSSNATNKHHFQQSLATHPSIESESQHLFAPNFYESSSLFYQPYTDQPHQDTSCLPPSLHSNAYCHKPPKHAQYRATHPDSIISTRPLTSDAYAFQNGEPISIKKSKSMTEDSVPINTTSESASCLIPPSLYSYHTYIEERLRYVLQHHETLCSFNICMPSVCQKSYGNERRYLCPPIVLYFLGVNWFNYESDEMVIMSNIVKDAEDENLSKSILYYNTDGKEISFYSEKRASANHEQCQKLNPVWASTMLKTIYYTGTGEHDKLGRSMQLQLQIDTKNKQLGIDKVRLGVISKPSQKRALAKVSDMSICHGDCVSLFNRYRAQHNNALFLSTSKMCQVLSDKSTRMKTSGNFFPDIDTPTVAENEQGRLIMTSDTWEPFYILSVEELKKGNGSVAANTQRVVLSFDTLVILVSKITGVQSPPLVLKKRENWKVSISCTKSHESFNCLSKLAFQCPVSKKFLSIDELNSGEVGYTEGEFQFNDKLNPSRATHSVLPWSAMWSIISTQSFNTNFYDEPIFKNRTHSVPSMPSVKCLYSDKQSLLYIYGTGFANDVQVWIGDAKCDVLKKAGDPLNTSTLPDVVSSSRFCSRLQAFPVNLTCIACVVPFHLWESKIKKNPILLFQHDTFFNSGFAWPLHS